MNSMVIQDNDSANLPESKFAHVLQGYQLNQQQDIFEIITNFKSIAALHALLIGERLNEGEQNNELKEEFENWDLETKLWHLVENLYAFRLSIPETPSKEYPFSSISVKQENLLRSNPKIREISLIIHWLQVNSKSIEVGNSEDESHGKWQNTRHALQNKDFEVLANKDKETNNLVDNLDSDSPLRSGKTIVNADNDNDSKNFYLIYKLILANKIQEAIDYANLTGNFTLALILIGAVQDYVDPIIDQEFINPPIDSDNMILDDINMDKTQDNSALFAKPSGIKHKLLWKKTVYKLSQQPNLNRNEKLIYNYLSGGDISLNLKESSSSWEEYLLLYLNQLYIYKLESFIMSSLPANMLNDESFSFAVPTPQLSSVDDILNTLLKTENAVSEQSTHPLRIIMGGIMINQVSTLLHNIIKSLNSTKDADSDSVLNKSHLLRVITHLAIFELISQKRNEVNVKDITKVMTLYVSKLSELQLAELIPIYLSFIPDEKDAREYYSLFLSSITDSEERSKQIEIAKKFSNIVTPSSYEFLEQAQPEYNENKMFNILRRTVERVMIETESNYKQSSKVIVHDDISNVDETDYKLYRSVEWFFENSMHEDAISASITIIRRFLLCGRVSSLKQFGKDKNFKQLIKEYDLESHINSISSPNMPCTISEENKEELLNYESFIQGLVLIDDWKQFLKDNKINGVLSKVTPNSFWKSNHINNSIEKVTNTLTKLIFQWLTDLITSVSKDSKIFKELRVIYVPYLIMELLQIYQYSRLNNWSYMRKAFKLVTEVANEDENDFLNCFVNCGRLDEFLVRCGEISVIACEQGISGIFH